VTPGPPTLVAETPVLHSEQMLACWCLSVDTEQGSVGPHPAAERGHLRSVLAEFVRYYNQDRPHRSLRLETPVPSPCRVDGEGDPRPVLVACITSTSAPSETDRLLPRYAA
jgi:hypothetical protein